MFDMKKFEEEFDDKFEYIGIALDWYTHSMYTESHKSGDEHLQDVKKFFRSFATRIVEEAQREERERIQQKLQELWSKDPRSFEGKKQGNTDAWMMGYRTAQKEISLIIGTKLQKMKGSEILSNVEEALK